MQKPQTAKFVFVRDDNSYAHVEETLSTSDAQDGFLFFTPRACPTFGACRCNRDVRRDTHALGDQWLTLVVSELKDTPGYETRLRKSAWRTYPIYGIVYDADRSAHPSIVVWLASRQHFDDLLKAVKRSVLFNRVPLTPAQRETAERMTLYQSGITLSS